MEHSKIKNRIQELFRTFGGGEATPNNPVAVALKDNPLQFAAGVDVEQVIRVILKESGYPALLAACKVGLSGLETMKEAYESFVELLNSKVDKTVEKQLAIIITKIQQAIADAEG